MYGIWNKMRQRCYNPKNERYKDYGGRGIRICDEWQNFELFWEWAQVNGYNDTLSIDRIDVNGNYCPENCRWADAKTQANNTRSNKRYTVQEKTLTESQWCRELGVSSGTIATWQRRHGEAYVMQRIEQALRERGEEETRKKIVESQTLGTQGKNQGL
ncbi:MAG: hypothetical protein J6K98_02340 [Clostridia bacterium]|nr:hypothetical protein [Clostridia bacterium]